MKKLFGIIFLILLLSGQTFAYNYDTKFKKNFYDSFVVNFFQSLQQSLISQGFKQENVYLYVSTLRARMNRKDLEDATWGCVSKYSPTQFQNETNKIINDCFDNWTNKFFFEKNSDALDLLKK
jgi:hypothetical protein